MTQRCGIKAGTTGKAFKSIVLGGREETEAKGEKT